VKAFHLLSCIGALASLAAAREQSSDLLELPYEKFDQTPGAGWRALADKNQLRQAAALIEAYLARRSDLDRFQRATLHWHAAQALAIAGDTEGALKYLAAARHNPEPVESPARWNDYVTATEAFLKNDRPALLAARERIASSKPDDPNLAIVDSLVAHFGQPYARAYKRKEPPAPK
jgi:hypothetical protein